MKLPKVLILYTGGTFGMVYDRDPETGSQLLTVPRMSPRSLRERLLRHAPEIHGLAHCDVEVLLNRDSANIGPAQWVLLANAIQSRWRNYDGFIVLHGTDTLAYSASALSFLLRPCLKPVILTGAQRPLAALRNDARMNLIAAVEIAAHGPRQQVSQVCVFFGDRLFQGNRVRKKSASDYAAFESPDQPPLAIVGTSIRYAEVEKRKGSTLKLNPVFSEKVLMCHLTPGFNALALGALVLRAPDSIEGLVLVVFPSGTGPSYRSDFFDLLEILQKRKIPAVIVTEGSTEPPGPRKAAIDYEASHLFRDSGCFPAGSMTPECAFVKTALLLGQGLDFKRFSERWYRNLALEGGGN
jgi:L-asparaginase